MKFKYWKAEVDQLCRAYFGCDADDLPDYLWHDSYQDGYSPRQAFFNFQEDLEDA